MSNDLHYTNGEWRRTAVLADCPEGTASDDYLKSIGWEEFLAIGDTDSVMHLKTWRRRHDAGVDYMLEVNDFAVCSPYVQVDSFPELMDLVARWAPVVQAATMSHLLNDLQGHFIDDTNGTVERLAARVRYGLEQMYDPMRREQRQHEEARRRMAEERRRNRPPTT